MKAAGLQATVHPGRVLAALASEARLRALAAVVLLRDESRGPLGPEAIDPWTGEALSPLAERAGLSVHDLRGALRRLEEAGLVGRNDLGRWEARSAIFASAAQAVGRMRPERGLDELGATEEQAVALRPYFEDGRLRSIPTTRRKRELLLDFLAQQFEPGRVYPEPVVNSVLGRFGTDYVTLRRYLVDADLLSRRDGHYWRSGGTFETEG
jgi:hypothetical protein